jgi:Zn-dependent protease
MESSEAVPFKIRIHRSFFQLFIVLALVVAFQGRGADAVIQFTAAFALLFAAVILHESSHAFVARSLGVQVRDIVVHPLGGMTRLDWTARNPRKEALISCAGPAVNLVMAGALWAVFHGMLDEPGRWMSWVVVPFLTANVALGALNLIPAFPMDGGRVLRAVLSTKMGHLPATRIAARIGRWVAALTLLAPFVGPSFGWSFLQSLALPIVGLFVLVLGELELKQAEAAELLSRMGAAARDAGGPGVPRDVIDVEATSRVVEDR